jgi:hypothetical protein
MSNVPSEIQCFADPEKVCPLRNAAHQVEELHAIPVEERTSVDDYNTKVGEIAKSLSGLDKYRFYSLLGTDLGISTIEPESCADGPSKSFGFMGRMICTAELRYEEWQPTAEHAA